MYADAVNGLDEMNPSHHAALGFALIEQGKCQLSLGKYQDGKHSIDRGLALLYPLEEILGILSGLYGLGFHALVTGNHEQARELYKQGLPLAKQHGGSKYIGGFWDGVAMFHKDMYSFENGLQLYQQGLSEIRQYDDSISLADYLNSFADFLLLNDKIQEAEHLKKECLALVQELDHQILIPGILDGLAIIAYRTGNYQQAQNLLLESLASVKEIGLAYFEVQVLSDLGKLATTLTNYFQAQEYFKQSFQLGLNINSAMSMAGTLVSFAELYIAQGQVQQAADWLSVSKHHPSTENHRKMEAERLLEQLQNQLPPDEFSAALERGKTLDLTEVVQKILAEL
jgi:tetratricopeptide (TPR) repeat protein